ncbi:MAG: hypothetical protein KatS3mg076_2046 [Candidatus Binatia bacterium]|nr:MAG: hypothetical protein KatS3mg076_2046 [Candidatus Binatia bacterium]
MQGVRGRAGQPAKRPVAAAVALSLPLTLLAVLAPARAVSSGEAILSPTGVVAGSASAAAVPEDEAVARGVGIPDRLIVKLKAGVATCLSCQVARRAPLGKLGVGSRLDELNRRYGVRAAKALVRSTGRRDVPASAAETAARLGRAAARFPVRALRGRPAAPAPDWSRTYVLELRRHPDLAAVARAYAADPAVEYCEPDAVVEAAVVPNDPFLATRGSWGQPFDDLWGVKLIGAPAAWDVTRGAGVVIAVLDTGVDYTHPDIAANIWVNPGEVPDNGLDDDGNGFVDDVRGWDFVNDDADPMDDNGHGSHVAGTAAAVGNNGIGLVGVAFESRIMAVRALGTFGSARVSDLVEPILYAVENGADIINASWGTSEFSQTLSEAVSAAKAAGVVFVAAAGNSGRRGAVLYPAADRNTIAVAAFTHEDVRANFSDFGIELDVGAPGGGDGPPPPAEQIPSFSILSVGSGAIDPFVRLRLDPSLFLEAGGVEYLRLAGTSMATPHVAGTAALVLAAHPSFSVEEVRQVLRTTAVDIDPPGPDDESGYGRIDAAAAVAAGPPLVAHIDEPAGGTIVGALSIDVRGTASGPDFGSYTVDYRPADDPTAPWTPIVGPVTTAVSGGLLASWDVSDLDDGDYVLRLTAERPGEAFTDRVPVSLRNVQIDSPEPLAAFGEGVTSIEIRGTAAGAGFRSYTVEYARPARARNVWRTDGLTLGGPPDTPVRNGLLATLDVSSLTEGERFDFRLTVENRAGTRVKTRSGIVVDPTLRAGWPQPLVPVADAEYLTVVDLDGDGIQEILAGSGDEVIVFEPDGTVRPGWPQRVATSAFPLVSTRGSPIVADVTGDGALDVIATNRNEIFVWSADGILAPGFPRVVDVFLGSLNDWITAADRDGDGVDDIICSGVRGVQTFRGDGSELPDSRIRLLSGNPAAPGDVDGDGRAELAVFDEKFGFRFRGNGFRGFLRVYRPDGTILAERPTRAKFFMHPGMADLDGDGLLDAWVATENRFKTRAKLRAVDAAGKRLRLKRQRTARGRRLTASSQFSFADLDRDGVPEAYSYESVLASRDSLEQFGYIVRHSVGRPETRRALRHRIFTGLDYDPAAMAIADVDGDGTQEFVVGVSGLGCPADDCVLGGQQLFPTRRGVVVQRPDGSLLPGFPKAVPEFAWWDGDPAPFMPILGGLDDRRANTPAVADLDGDGLKEVIWVDPETTRIFVWTVNGTPGPLVADWPMYHHDPQHTNVFPVGP